MTMKKLSLSLLLFILFATNLFAQMTPKRERLFNCVHYSENSDLERIEIFESHFNPSKIFYELKLISNRNGYEITDFKKVNLLYLLGGRILHFTKGNVRVKINLINEKEQKFETFARIPSFDVHSKNWGCKKTNNRQYY